MSGGRVDQTSVPLVLRDHRKRIRDLEAVPQGSPVYVQDILLSANQADIVFAAPPSSLHLLELTWLALLTTNDESVIYFFLNGDSPGSVSQDNFWNLTVNNQVGSQGSLDTGGAGITDGGGFAYVGGDQTSWGTLRLPDYNADLASIGGNLRGPWYSGHGGWADTGGGATPDTWVVSGYRQEGGQAQALTAIQLNALRLSDNSVMTFAAGSRFTLSGY